jgi:hypothetical protein
MLAVKDANMRCWWRVWSICWATKRITVLDVLKMNARVRELIAIALVSAYCAGVAVALDQEFFAPVFLALSVIAGVAAIRRKV